MAFALVRHEFAGRSSTNLLIFLPMATPEIVMGSSLLALFVAAGFGGRARVRDDPDRAHHVLHLVRRGHRARPARGHERHPRTGGRRPLRDAVADLLEGHLPAGVPRHPRRRAAGFSLSFDDFIVTNLNAGTTTTFPIYVWGVAQRGVPMQVNVVGTADVRDLDRRSWSAARRATEPGRARSRPAAWTCPRRSPRRGPDGTRTATRPRLLTRRDPLTTATHPAGVRQSSVAALSRTTRRICSISSKCAWSQISGGDELDDRVAAVVGAAVEAGVVERLGQEAAEQALGLVVVERLLGRPCP